MSYMGLFWETGMPEAWALSRKSGEKPEAGPTGESRLDFGTAAPWPQNMPNTGADPVIPGQPVVLPGIIESRPAPDDGKTKE